MSIVLQSYKIKSATLLQISRDRYISKQIGGWQC